jgi:hypothetical protein
MFIQTEQTPNPATLKFLPGCPVMTSGTANFSGEEAARISPLAERLFSLPEVTGVFLGADFVTVTKTEDADWYRLKPAILAVVMEHFTAGASCLAIQRPARQRQRVRKTKTRSWLRSKSYWRHACGRPWLRMVVT